MPRHFRSRPMRFQHTHLSVGQAAVGSERPNHCPPTGGCQRARYKDRRSLQLCHLHPETGRRSATGRRVPGHLRGTAQQEARPHAGTRADDAIAPLASPPNVEKMPSHPPMERAHPPASHTGSTSPPSTAAPQCPGMPQDAPACLAQLVIRQQIRDACLPADVRQMV
jgi:hypothetical protein